MSCRGTLRSPGAKQHLKSATPTRVLKKPLRVLDAPGITDDFYSNILDWSATDWAAVGLQKAVWLWHSRTGKVTRLFESCLDECVMSVACSNAGKKIAAGFVSGHSFCTTALAFSGNLLASGAKDSKILLRDVRCPAHFVARFTAHRSAICGLKWSHEVDPKLASGGNDNKIIIWKPGYCEPFRELPIHRSAIKALAWSPHHYSQLVTGAGTRDKRIRLWNVSTGALLKSVETSSQVCNLTWSRSCNEIVSTHGFTDNSLQVWKCPSLTRVAYTVAHPGRVLHLALSPCGRLVMTGAGDQTLRLWDVFPSDRASFANGRLLNHTCNQLR
ncbi:hypothetical protein WJX84_011785 [Apatococcus fuscideae]|uniref:CDC20/Fizzy WD40 domain-containing protein n=1 Tax=Apatococcus fuscideae TaxID=2026836 RepID=A0AAW1TG63_9CHLO